MSNPNPNKPAKSHPWRVPLKVHDWAKEQSTIRNVSNVVAARPDTLSRKDNNRAGQL